jgi:hypothetical protein
MSGTRRKPGRMSAYIAGFGAWLLVAAYTPGTVRNMLKDAGHLGRWMERADIEAAQLDWDLVQAFRRALGRPKTLGASRAYALFAR